MSSSECECDEENKLAVLIVPEGDITGGDRSNLNICGTLERHNVRNELRILDENTEQLSSARNPVLCKESSIPSDQSVSDTMKQSKCSKTFENQKPLAQNTPISESNQFNNSGSSSTSQSDETVFDGKLENRAGDLVSSWNGQTCRGQQEYRRLKKSRSWCAEMRDDGNSDVRLLRERLLRTQSRPQPTVVKKFSHRQRMMLASLALVDFMSFCSMSIMAPFFPREATDKGMSEVCSGFVFSFYALVMFLSSPVFGKILPVIGAKFLFMSGMFVAGACNILFGTLELMHDRQIFTVFCFVIRGLEALGASAYSTASYVFVVNTFPSNIGTVLGILETFVGLGMSVGPAIGGLLYSVGGFGLPFYVLGVAMVLAVPLNYCLLVDDTEYTITSKSGSVLQLLKIPSIIITGLVIVIVSNIWAFLDPTLEPHLRQFNLSTEQIGLIFLLFSALYGIFSPIWGWLADRVHNHWCMMVWGLLLCTVGLLLLGPSPFIPGLKSELWLNLVALSILGVSVALTLLPTFQGVLASSIYEGGCEEALATYSVVAGVWSCCYSLGEVLGPAVGGAVASYYTFPLCTTIMAAMCFTMAVVTLTFFSLKDSSKLAQSSASLSESLPYSDATWMSHDASACETDLINQEPREDTPLISSYKGQPGNASTNPSLQPSKKSKSTSASISELIAYVFMFKFITENISKCFKTYHTQTETQNCTVSYQNYTRHEAQLDTVQKKNSYYQNSEDFAKDAAKSETIFNDFRSQRNEKFKLINENDPTHKSNDLNDNIVANRESIIPGESEEAGYSMKKNGMGLVPRLSVQEHRRPSAELLQHNWNKVKFFEQTLFTDDQDMWCTSTDITNVRGTISISNSGACEV